MDVKISLKLHLEITFEHIAYQFNCKHVNLLKFTKLKIDKVKILFETIICAHTNALKAHSNKTGSLPRWRPCLKFLPFLCALGHTRQVSFA